MTEELTQVLKRAAGPVPPAPSVAALVRAGQHDRNRTRVATAVAAVTGVALVAVGVATALPTATAELVGQVSVDPADGAAVTATDGNTAVLPADATPVRVDARVLPGVGPDVRLAAVADDGRVAVSATGSDLVVTHPDSRDATPLSLPAEATRCWSIAFDPAGDLWALCNGHGDGTTRSALLLRYPPDATEASVSTVTDLITAVIPSWGSGRLWVHDGLVTAVVPTDDPNPPADGEQQDWGNASTVVLVEHGTPMTAETTTIEALPSLRDDDTAGSVGAGTGDRIIDQQTTDGRTIQIAWLTHTTTATLEGPAHHWDLVSMQSGDAFVGSTIAVTYELFRPDAALAYGIVADGKGTTTVMQLPTAAEGMNTLPDLPSPTPLTTIRVSPDGTAHLLAADGATLTTAVLPAPTS